MPQLVKGGKWVFCWCIVGPTGWIQIPPQAYAEYGFNPGEKVLFLRGSRRSGGISLGKPAKIDQSLIKLRVIGETIIENNGKVIIPGLLSINPGDKLLTVRGSGLALGFMQFWAVFEQALKHSEMESFSCEDK
jgi:hypothetical protein